MRVNAAKVRKASPRASKQCALHRSKPHKPRRGLGVANARLGRVEHRAARPRRRLQSGRRAPRSTAPASLAARAQHSLRGGHLDGVAQRGARAVQLDALHVTGARARGRKRAAQHTLLRRPVGRRQRACAAVLVHAARQHRRVRLRGRPATARQVILASSLRPASRQAAQERAAARLGAHIAVRASVKRLAAAVGREHASPAAELTARRRQMKIHATDESAINLHLMPRLLRDTKREQRR